ncbi:MAG: rod shape-determining protein MreC [Acidimicrobiales bacterium]
MALSRRTSRPRFTLLVLVLASVTVITLSFRGGKTEWLAGVRGVATDVFSPIQSGASAVFGPIGSFFAGAANYGGLKAKNAKLRSEIAGLKAAAADSSVQQRQLAGLNAVSHLPFAPSLAHVVTQVVARSASNFQDTIQLDKGTGAGIRVGMPAVSGTGLVGTVVQVAANRSTVSLITDESSSVGVVFATKNSPTSLALATGQGAGQPLSVSLIPPGTKLYKSTAMVTSGISGSRYPPDIPVGNVSSASQAPGSQTEKVLLTPDANMAQLEYVDVLLFKQSTVVP